MRAPECVTTAVRRWHASAAGCGSAEQACVSRCLRGARVHTFAFGVAHVVCNVKCTRFAAAQRCAHVGSTGRTRSERPVPLCQHARACAARHAQSSAQSALHVRRRAHRHGCHPQCSHPLSLHPAHQLHFARRQIPANKRPVPAACLHARGCRRVGAMLAPGAARRATGRTSARIERSLSRGGPAARARVACRGLVDTVGVLQGQADAEEERIRLGAHFLCL